MLLGAFLIGYFFGSNANQVVEKKFTPVNEKATELLDIQKESRDKEEITERKKAATHIDLEELSRPGPVRALKTRERSGSLSDDAKLSIAEEKLDFETLGRGSRFNKDDFQKIVGIGPFIEEKLNSIGIYNYSQLSKMKESDMDAISSMIDFFPGRIQRDDWKGQAEDLSQKAK